MIPSSCFCLFQGTSPWSATTWWTHTTCCCAPSTSSSLMRCCATPGRTCSTRTSKVLHPAPLQGHSHTPTCTLLVFTVGRPSLHPRSNAAFMSAQEDVFPYSVTIVTVAGLFLKDYKLSVIWGGLLALRGFALWLSLHASRCIWRLMSLVKEACLSLTCSLKHVK